MVPLLIYGKVMLPVVRDSKSLPNIELGILGASVAKLCFQFNSADLCFHFIWLKENCLRK